MLPCITALFSPGVPAARLLTANFGRSPLALRKQKWPLSSNIRMPFGIGAKQVGPDAALLVDERDERPGSDEFIGRLGDRLLAVQSNSENQR
jgi:hypothetical protein